MAMLTRRFSRIATVGLRTPAIRAAVERSWGAHSELLAAAKIPGVSLHRTTSVISVVHFHGLADRAASGSELLQDVRGYDLTWRSERVRSISFWKLFMAKLAPKSIKTNDVTASDVEQMVDEDSGILIDVRNRNEIEETGKIGRAINVPLGEISEAFSLSDDEFLTKYDAPKPLKSDRVVVYCRSGVRAASGCDELDKLGFETVMRYPGSWLEWSKLHPVVIPNDVTTNEVERMVNNISGILLDVRNPNELEETGRIGHAINIPLGEIAAAFKLSDAEFRLKYGAPLPPKDVEDMVVYCRSGVRAANACQELIRLDYLKVMRYPGSWLEWSARSPET